MKVQIIEEHGYSSALLGLSLSYNQDPAHMAAVAEKLRFKGEGHNKSLETIVVWMDIDAARYFWQQFDTYRIGVAEQSESTIRNMAARPLQLDNFEHPIPKELVQHLNALIADEQWQAVKRDLPESFCSEELFV